MSELSRQIAANTQGVYNAGRELVALKARNRERKKQAYADIAGAIKDAHDEYQKHLSWRDAKQVEDEVQQIEGAYALGYSTKGGEGARVALSGLRPKTAKGAVLLSARLRDAAGDQRYETEWKAKEAERAADRKAKQRAVLADLAIASAEKEAKAKELEYKERKDALDREAEMERTRFKTNADALKWWFSRKPEDRPDPDDMPIPDNQRTLIEKREGLPEGYLTGVTPKRLAAMIQASRPPREPAPRAPRDPRTPPRAAAQLDAIEARIRAVDDFINANAGLSSMKDEVTDAREQRADLIKQQDQLINTLPDGSGGGAPAPADHTSPKSGGFDTRLTAEEERLFQAWKSKYAPNDSGADYDLRGAFKDRFTPDANGHWPDKWKKPNHPTFSDESIYAKFAPDRAGRWSGETYIPTKPRDSTEEIDPEGEVIPDGKGGFIIK